MCFYYNQTFGFIHMPFFETSDSSVPVKVSAKSARLLFEGCSSAYIQNVCKGAFCHLKSSPTGPVVKVEDRQQPPLVSLGASFVDGIMQTVNGACVFYDGGTGFCQVHLEGIKPQSCIQSPFFLNKNDILLIRNRYKMLRCYRAEGSVPAYVAFRSSLDLLFGAEESARIVSHLENKGGDIIGYMVKDMYVFNKSITENWKQSAKRTRPKRRSVL